MIVEEIDLKRGQNNGKYSKFRADFLFSMPAFIWFVDIALMVDYLSNSRKMIESNLLKLLLPVAVPYLIIMITVNKFVVNHVDVIKQKSEKAPVLYAIMAIVYWLTPLPILVLIKYLI